MKKILYLEGLRGLAAFIVLLSHLQWIFEVNFAQNLEHLLDPHLPCSFVKLIVSAVCIFINGPLAVHVFWLLSAYVICIKLFDNTPEDSNNYLVSGAAKRYFRLFLPSAASIFIAYFFMQFGWMQNQPVALQLNHQGLKGIFDFTPHFFKAVKSAIWDVFVKGGSEYNNALWTMKTEFLGSLFCFSIFGIFRKNRKRLIVCAVLLLWFLALREYGLLCFLLGLLLCDFDYCSKDYTDLKPLQLIRKTDEFFRNNALISLLVFACILFTGSVFLPFLHVPEGFIPVIISSTIVYFVIRIKLLNVFFQTKVMAWLGKVSFSLYLIHWSIICSFSCRMYLSIGGSHLEKVIWTSLASIGLCLLSAGIFYRFVDKPGLLLVNKIGNRFKGGKGHS